MSKEKIGAALRNLQRAAEPLARIIETLPADLNAMTVRDLCGLRDKCNYLMEKAEEVSDEIYWLGNPRSPVRPLPDDQATKDTSK